MITILHIYNEREQTGWKKMQTIQFKEKRGTRKCFVGAKSCAKGDKKLKEKPEAKGHKGSGDLRAGPHLARLPACGKELKEGRKAVKETTNTRKLRQTEFKEGPNSSPSKQKNLVALAPWFWLWSQRYKQGIVESSSPAKENHWE